MLRRRQRVTVGECGRQLLERGRARLEVGEIDVVERDGTRRMMDVGVLARHIVADFRRRSGLHARGDGGCIFRTVHGDSDVLAGGAAMAVGNPHRIGERHHIVGTEEVECTVGNVVVPADGAITGDIRMRRRINAEGIYQRILLCRCQRIAMCQHRRHLRIRD